MAIINGDSIVTLSNIIKYEVGEFLTVFSNFNVEDRPKIEAYYSGTTKSANSKAFNLLSALLEEATIIDDKINGSRDRIVDIILLEVVETLSDIHTSLETISNSSKWLRSVISKGNFNPSIQLEHTLKMFQTLEDVSRSQAQSSSPQNDWVSIALSNDLIEEDYTPDGGVKLKVGQKNRANIKINSVIDTIDGETIYGKDIDKKFKFDVEQEDVKVLSPKQTIVQSVDILGGLKQGDNPEFRGEGIQAGIIVGGNRAAVNYPILFRQITSTFQADDTLKSLQIIDINIEGIDAVSIEVQVQTRLGESISTALQN